MTTSQVRGNEQNEHDAELFNDSLERCTSDRRFLERFYELFIASSAEEGKPEGNVHLERIAARHSRNALDIGPHLYDQWLECLIQAARECDPLFGGETEQAWRRVMRVGIEFLKSRYLGGCLQRPAGNPG